ncbi:enoyl-CoA hydratase/isomerase family protein [Pseudodonghicola flavimaris]|uniref:Enoyl-CoA hydratase-related protein n=1 Tax=Pseudodonghicola flavimaris TaxID=3050036 RepID=A0ABT7F6E0_9RHOB|nr:enoyl-CoA hydratase-related protein [Pseudodonghicola flavimaris]MDK3020166.1 enoyl-CoA hydratase-related protein [Pseudodonghicola flavimaris]
MTALPPTKHLDLELDDGAGWLTVWFNDPARRNPLSAARAADLIRLAAHLQDRGDIRGVVFRGRGGVFSAGGDLKAFQQVFQGGADREAVLAASLEGGRMFRAIAGLPQFTVMLIEGAAMAGGLGLAACGDLVIAEAGARFSLSETRIGLTPAQIAPYLVARLGMVAARRLMLTGTVMTADRARELGLVDEIATGQAGIGAALARAREDLRPAAPGAVAAIKAQLARMPLQDDAARMQTAAESFAGRMLSDEGREGIAAFFEKRAASWAVSGDGGDIDAAG